MAAAVAGVSSPRTTAQRAGRSGSPHTGDQSTTSASCGSASERLFVQAFHKALADGACDQLLTRLRPVWDEHAAASPKHERDQRRKLGRTRLAVGLGELVECWQQLPGHLAALNQIAAVARQFGPRVGNFPLINDTPTRTDSGWKTRAIWCADGSLEADSAAFRRPGTHRHTPGQRAAASAQRRLEHAKVPAVGIAQWEAAPGSAGPTGGYIDEDGEYHEPPQTSQPVRRS